MLCPVVNYLILHCQVCFYFKYMVCNNIFNVRILQIQVISIIKDNSQSDIFNENIYIIHLFYEIVNFKQPYINDVLQNSLPGVTLSHNSFIYFQVIKIKGFSCKSVIFSTALNVMCLHN